MSDEPHMEHPLDIRVQRQGDDVAVLHLSGNIDELAADDLGAALDEVMADGRPRIILDLTDVWFMGSTGLGQIMRTYRAVRKEDGYVRIANPQPLIADLFAVTKINKLLDIYPTVEDALAEDIFLEEA